MAPRYKDAAKLLQPTGIKLGSVDCTQNVKLCESFGIRGYPTLKVYNEGEERDYEGQREAEDIARFMRRQTMPPVSELKASEVAEFAKENGGVAIVGVFGEDAEGKKAAEAYSKIAKSLGDDYAFGSLRTGIYLVKPFDEGHVKYSGDVFGKKGISTQEGEASLKKWIGVESLPLMDEVNPENYAKYVGSGLPIAYLFYSGAEMREKYGKMVEELVAPYKGKLFAVYIDAEKFDGHAKSLTLPEKWPGFVIHEPENDLKYPFDASKDGLTKEGIRGFLESYSKGSLKPTFRSELVPENPVDEDGVRKVVNSNFEEVIFGGKQDVLLMIHAPWCGACKRIAPAYAQVAKAYSPHTDKIIIARMDGTENDIPKRAKINLTKFPTIVFFKAGGKSQYEMERPTDSVDSLVDFVKSHSSYKLNVTIPEDSSNNSSKSSEKSSTDDSNSKDEL